MLRLRKKSGKYEITLDSSGYHLYLKSIDDHEQSN